MTDEHRGSGLTSEAAQLARRTSGTSSALRDTGAAELASVGGGVAGTLANTGSALWRVLLAAGLLLAAARTLHRFGWSGS